MRERIRRRLERASSAPTGKGVVVLALAVSLFLIGTNTGSAWLYLLASACLVLVGVSVAWSTFSLKGLRASRGGVVRATIGELVEYPVELESGRRNSSIVLVDTATGSRPALVPPCNEGGRLRGSFRAAPEKRGVFASEPLSACCEAPFGLWRTRRKVPCAGDVEVAPPLADIGLPPGLGSHLLQGEGKRKPPRRGRGFEFFALREYQSGDSVRHIYWPATARRQEVVVREFEEEGVTPLVVVPMTCGPSPDSVFDRVLSVAGTLTKAAVKAHIPVRLVLPDKAGSQPEVLDSPSATVLRSALASAPAPVSSRSVLAAASLCRRIPMASVVWVKAASSPWPQGAEGLIDFAVVVLDRPETEAPELQRHLVGVRTWFVLAEGPVCFESPSQPSAA